MIKGIDNDTAISCLRLADRIAEKYCPEVLQGGAAGRSALPIAATHSRARYRFHKGNPVPPDMRRRILSQVKMGFAYGSIGKANGVSIGTVQKIARAGGIKRGQGRIPRLAHLEPMAA